jgi:alkylation response protein AidB-like acyl-CoA dehydrogenase
MSRTDLNSLAEPEISAEEDLTELRNTLRRLLDRHAVELTTPAGDFDRPLWALLSQQVGVAGLAVPERFGGSGGGYLECHLVLEELGRTGVATPFLASAVLATQAVLLSGAVAAADLLPDLAAGNRTATLILDPGCTLTATGDGGSWVVDGQARGILDGARADLLLAFAQPSLDRAAPKAPARPALFLLDTAHPGLHRTWLPTMDQSLHLAEVNCRAVPARLLSEPADLRPTARLETADPASRLADLAAIAITAEQVGGARRCLEMTVEYTKNRVQFGRPIGSFQAVKHRLADLLVLLESANSASQAAAIAWASAADDASILASLAKSYCSEAYRAVTAETIQLHGGLGFTWEHPAHRYFKRAHSTSALFGDPTYHRGRLAERLGLLDPPGPAS